MIDASPDDSRARILAACHDAPFRTVLVDHARNFGSFAAIRTGLADGTGDVFGVMAADLQEPPELMVASSRALGRRRRPARPRRAHADRPTGAATA